jgi:hypothetical protein
VSSALEEKLERDLEITRQALEKVRVVAPSRSYARRIAEDFLGMARAYYEDALHFKERNEPVKAFACVNYAHGWLDAGARLGVFDTGDDERLFTLL